MVTYCMINQIMKVCQKIKNIQYNVALAITDAIRGTSQMKLCNELGFGFLKFKQWVRKLFILQD